MSFRDYCNHIIIDSKDSGVIPLGPNLNGAQNWLINELSKCLNAGIQHITILKLRQAGITTLMLALTLYWITRYNGMQGLLAVDTDSNRESFRNTLQLMWDYLPKRMKAKVVKHNRNVILFGNRSRLNYHTVGTKAGASGIFKGKGINYYLGSEGSSWAGGEARQSIVNSFSDSHPRQFFLDESTARGFNEFHEEWETAKRTYSRRGIFIGFWRLEKCWISKDDPRYNVWWDGRLNYDERGWVREVKRLYDYEVQPEQMAWWRFYLNEKQNGDLAIMYQDFPPTEDLAFIMSGAQFFGTLSLSEAMRSIKKHPDLYYYQFGEFFYDTEIRPTSNLLTGELSIWEYPKPDGIYVIGADPAFGSSDTSDAYALQVCRCYGDKLEQVAEFRKVAMNGHQFAWVIAHLAGMYRGKRNSTYVNLEITGPGQDVVVELQQIQRMQHMIPPDLLARDAETGKDKQSSFYNVVAQMAFYLYRRVDTASIGYAYHWKTTSDTKNRAMHDFRSNFENNHIVINSAQLLKEMRYIVQDGLQIMAEGNAKDDRVMAMSFACVHWYEKIRAELKGYGILYEREKEKEKIAAEDNKKPKTYISNIVVNYLHKRGMDVGRK